MENQPFFSVIIPVYGVEKYLEKAINSVLNQTFKDFEIILVDDKSLDRCGEICEDFKKKYNNITVIHHVMNQGLSAARNTGMGYAKGKYIWFMDSDDYVENTLLEKVYNSLQLNEARVVIFGLREEYYDENNKLKNVVDVSLPYNYLKDKKEVRKAVIKIEESTLYGYAWNKVYDLAYLKQLDIKFEQVTLIEDIIFNIQYFENIDKINIISDILYYYEKRIGNSLTGKYVENYFDLHRQRVQMLYDQQKRWALNSEMVKSILGKIYCRYIYSAVQRNLDKRAEMNFYARRQWMKRIFNDELFQEIIPYAKSDNFQQRIMLFFLKNKISFGCLMLGRIIDLVKNKMPIFFAKIK